MSLADLGNAPLLLVDAFDALAELQAQAESHARSTKKQAEQGNPGTLR